ncbi:MAG TPA: hypothetical protein VIF37_01470 [Methylobacter sp.]|jgi:hypothetical protein
MSDVAATITTAFATGQSNVSLAAAGVITLVAVVTGISLIVGLLRK